MLDSINDYSQNQLSLYEHSLGYQMDFDTFENLITDSDFLASIKYCSTIDDNDLKKPIPVFNAYYWQTNETNIDPLHLTFSYEEICKYPYYYKDEDLSVTAEMADVLSKLDISVYAFSAARMSCSVTTL